MKLSVILPVAKLEHFTEALLSVIVAAEGIDYEIVLIDVTRYGIKSAIHPNLKNIKIISQPDATYERAIYIGLQNSDGNFIGLMNDDDLCTPNRFDIQIELLESSVADIAICKMQKIGKRSVNMNFSPDLTRFSAEMQLFGAYGANAAVMFRKEWLLNHFEISHYPVWDWQFALQKFQFGKIVGTNKKLYLYRQHSNQISASRAHLEDVLNSIPMNWLDFQKRKMHKDQNVPLAQAIFLPRQRKLRNIVSQKLEHDADAPRVKLLIWLFWYYKTYVRKRYSPRNKLWFFYHGFVRFMLV
jgi:glycosyltransferase involved in cell wall biosynthesis